MWQFIIAYSSFAVVLQFSDYEGQMYGIWCSALSLKWYLLASVYYIISYMTHISIFFKCNSKNKLILNEYHNILNIMDFEQKYLNGLIGSYSISC